MHIKKTTGETIKGTHRCKKDFLDESEKNPREIPIETPKEFLEGVYVEIL